MNKNYDVKLYDQKGNLILSIRFSAIAKRMESGQLGIGKVVKEEFDVEKFKLKIGKRYGGPVEEKPVEKVEKPEKKIKKKRVKKVTPADVSDFFKRAGFEMDRWGYLKKKEDDEEHRLVINEKSFRYEYGIRHGKELSWHRVTWAPTAYYGKLMICGDNLFLIDKRKDGHYVIYGLKITEKKKIIKYKSIKVGESGLERLKEKYDCE